MSSKSGVETVQIKFLQCSKNGREKITKTFSTEVEFIYSKFFAVALKKTTNFFENYFKSYRSFKNIKCGESFACIP